ncbi:NAD(P)-binding domain-containing protein, partial [Cohaesibacter celericrescens]
MGAPMAEHLLDAGHELTVFDVGTVPEALTAK